MSELFNEYATSLFNATGRIFKIKIQKVLAALFLCKQMQLHMYNLWQHKRKYKTLHIIKCEKNGTGL